MHVEVIKSQASCVNYIDLENKYQHERTDAEQAQNCTEFNDPQAGPCKKPLCPGLTQQHTGKLLLYPLQ